MICVMTGDVNDSFFLFVPSEEKDTVDPSPIEELKVEETVILSQHLY